MQTVAATNAAITAAIKDDGSVEPAFQAALEVAPNALKHMVRARIVSARMALLQRTERIGFHTSSIGEEAAIVGAVLATRSSDWVFPGAREWYAALARGLPLANYVHHAYGSLNDVTKGHSPPDHAPSRAFNIVPPSGVLGAHLPQATGAAWAAKIKKENVATLALFGAEVCEGGDFHNAMNFAGVFKAPCVLLCRTPNAEANDVARRAVAYGVASARVDGSDVLAVFAVVRAALERAYAGQGATLIEAISPTLKAAARLDDAALASTDEGLFALGERDPIARLRTLLKSAALGGDEVRSELDAAIATAEKAGPPNPSTIFDDVYASVPPHLKAQEQTMRTTRTASS